MNINTIVELKMRNFLYKKGYRYGIILGQVRCNSDFYKLKCFESMRELLIIGSRLPDNFTYFGMHKDTLCNELQMSHIGNLDDYKVLYNL